MSVTYSRSARIGAVSLIVMAGFAVAFALSQANFLLFHSLAEGFSVIVAVAIFILAWNTRDLLENDYLLFLGIAYLAIAALDSVHLLAYKGMGVFPGNDPDVSTQLWIAARYLEAGALVLAPTFIVRKVRPAVTLGVFATIAAAVFMATFALDIMPTAFIEGEGLTTFKVASEYVIMAMLAAALVRLRARRDQFVGHVFGYLAVGILLTIGSEMAFTLYTSVFAVENVVGHLLKVASFGAVYHAVVVTGLRRPQEILYSDLAAREASEHRVAEVLQDAMFSEVPFTFGYTIATAYRTTSRIARIGGDFWDFMADRDRLVALIGDVSGKGLSAATLTTIAKRTVRAFAHRHTSPGSVLKDANRVLVHDLEIDRFVTLALVFVDRESGSAEIALAGHCKPLLIDGGVCTLLDIPGDLPLGMMEDATYEATSLSLEPGQILVLYTDGLVDARGEGRLWGDERLCRHLGANTHRPMKDMLESALDAAAEFAGGAQRDDAAIVAIRRDDIEPTS